MILCSKHPNKYDKFNIKTDIDNIDVYLKPDNALLWDPRKDLDIKDASLLLLYQLNVIKQMIISI